MWNQAAITSSDWNYQNSIKIAIVTAIVTLIALTILSCVADAAFIFKQKYNKSTTQLKARRNIWDQRE